MRFVFFSIFLTSFSFSDNLSNSLTSQGFTGLINTPNAQVIKEGDATFQYSTQKDNHLREYDYNAPMSDQENFLVGIGFLSSLELTAKLVENQGRTRDLSGNIKYKLPLEGKYLPNIAIGWQDVGSAVSFYENRYIVLDKEFDFVRASLGYGDSNNNFSGIRMNGFFGGLEAKIVDGVSLLAEYDGEESHTAIRFRTPKNWLSGVSVEGMIAQNLTEPETSFSINLHVPLFPSSKLKNSLYASSEKKSGEKLVIPTKIPVDKKLKSKKSTPKAIQDKLVAIGFENVQVGYYNKSLYVKLENTIFNHNELDAIGVILGTIIRNSQDERHYIVTLLKNNLQTLTLSGDINLCQEFFLNPSRATEKKFKENLRFTRTFNERNVHFVTKKEKSSFFVPRLELSPALTTTIGTEVGLFDYLVGIRANAYMNLYDGLTVSTMYEAPLFNSENFDNGRVFARIYKDRLEKRFVNTMLHQTVHFESMFNTVSIGQYQSDYLGLLNHFNFTSLSGEHSFNAKVGRFRNQKDNLDDMRDVYLGSYRYFYAPLNLFTEFSYGQYWEQDKGAMVEMKRFFGDTSVAFYIKNTVKSYAGFEVSLPLTLRKMPKSSSFGQLKGKSDFSYGVRTVVESPDNANYLTVTGGIFPKTDLDLTTVYLNRDRLSVSYIKENLNRIRESFILYNEKEFE